MPRGRYKTAGMWKTKTSTEVTTVASSSFVPFHFHNFIGIIGKRTPIKPPNAQIPPQRPASPALMEYCSWMYFIPYPIKVATRNMSKNAPIVENVQTGLETILPKRTSLLVKSSKFVFNLHFANQKRFPTIPGVANGRIDCVSFIPFPFYHRRSGNLIWKSKKKNKRDSNTKRRASKVRFEPYAEM